MERTFTIDGAGWAAMAATGEGGPGAAALVCAAAADALSLWADGTRAAVRVSAPDGAAAEFEGGVRTPLAERARALGPAASGAGPWTLDPGRADLRVRLALAEGPSGTVLTWRSADAEEAAEAYAATVDLLTRAAADPLLLTSPAPAARLPRRHARMHADANARPPAPGTDRLIQEAVAATAERHPDRPAVLSPTAELTYRELVERSRRIGRLLRERGADAATPVAVCLDKGVDQPVAAFAALEAGAPWCPLAPDLPEARRTRLLAAVGARTVLTRTDLAARLSWPEGVRVLAVDDPSAWGGGPADPLEPAQTPTDPAYIVHTSGSTGEPKGVAVSHRGALTTVLDTVRSFGIGPGDRTLSVSSFSFDLAVWDLLAPLCAGGAVVVPDPGAVRDPAHWLELGREREATLWMSAPALFEAACEHAERTGADGPPLRLVLLGGDWIPLGLPDRARALAPGCRFASVGGATEASIIALLHEVDRVDPAWTSIPYGTPVAGHTWHVLDGAMRPRPAGVSGELWIGGAGLAQGYWRDPERTAASFTVHPETGERLYRTGDLGRRGHDGVIELLGRRDLQVQIGGHRIEPGEVETALLAHPAVRAAAVKALAHGDRPGHRALAAYACAAAGTHPTPDALKEHLRGLLPEPMVPAHVALLPELPVTANGKTDRDALPDPEPASAGGGAPRTAIERAVAAIWSDVLGVGEVALDDDFFALGGHSLLAIRVMNRVREELAVDLDLHTLLRAGTLGAVSAAVTRRKAEAPPPADELPQAVPAPEDRYAEFPLTDQQQAYAVGRTGGIAAGGVSAHVYREFDGSGVDLDRLADAWRRVVRRHDMLRAVIDPERMCQRVLPEVPDYRIEVADLRGRGPEDVRTGLEGLRERLSHEVRPADRWPLFTVAVALTDGDRVRVCLSLDALIADFASIRVLLRDLDAYYRDPGADLGPVGPTYRDCVLAAARVERTPLHERSWAYWSERLPELAPAPDLPLAAGVDPAARARFERRTARLSPERWRAFRERAADRGLSSTGALLAAYCEVLAGWSRSPRFTVSVPRLNRLPVHPEVDEVVGEFASFTLLTVDAGAGGRFEDRAQAVQDRLWSDLGHQYTSGVRVLRELMRLRGRFDGPLMPVVLTSTTAMPSEDRALLGGLLEPGYAVSQTPQVWMDLVVEDRAGELVVNWDVREALFPDGMVADMFAALAALVGRLADGDAAWGEEDPAPPPAPPSARGPDRPVPEERAEAAFTRRAAARPDGTALITSSGELTYGELYERAHALAGRLRRRGAGADRPVGVLTRLGPDQAAAVLGTLLAGAPYLPIDPDQPPARIDGQLRAAGARLLVTEPALDRPWPEGVRRLLAADPASDPDPGPHEGPGPEATPDGPAYTIFTSGTAGRPKAAVISHRGLVNALDATVHAFGIGPDDRVLAVTAAHHDMSAFDLLGALGAGAAVVLPEDADRKDPEHWARMAAEHRVTVWNSVPAAMGMLLDHLERTGTRLPALRLAFLGGDWIPTDMPGRLAGAAPGAEAVSVGGPTETTLWNIWHRVRPGDADGPSIPYGRPVPNTAYRILDEHMRERPVWAVGQMYCSGPGVALGYAGDAEAERDAFTTDPDTGERMYRTGDLGWRRPDGVIVFAGRADRQVQIAGRRIEPGEIEAALRDHPAVRAAAVTAVGGEGGPGHRALAGYTAVDEGGPTAAELRAHLRGLLPDHLVPATLTVLDRLPLTPNGKVDTAALPAPEAPAPAGGAVPRTDLERVLAAEWARGLDRAEVGAEDGFFALGGDSVAATRIVARLRGLFEGATIRLRTLFAAPSVRAMAALMSEEGDGDALERTARIVLEIERLSTEEVDRALAGGSEAGGAKGASGR
ncbi:non-ribosomal peptide synthetase [Nocardiopsis baichengensis]|uniref:non-ribosomal peptide synthetase n=1 Tax=Nocardiopsis baichengensis TaxID=280240 RepID=UPI000345A2C5|nr:non-ribosomal peptide synthetase [Nocardiopsis baichengensis]